MGAGALASARFVDIRPNDADDIHRAQRPRCYRLPQIERVPGKAQNRKRDNGSRDNPASGLSRSVAHQSAFHPAPMLDLPLVDLKDAVARAGDYLLVLGQSIRRGQGAMELLDAPDFTLDI